MNEHRADLRPRMTRRAAQFLERGERLIVVGGPLTGRSSMLRNLALAMPGLPLHDDISRDDLSRLLASGTSRWVASIDPLRLQGIPDDAGVRLIPLVNLSPVDLRRACERNGLDSRDLFDWSAGHPYLAAGYGDDARRLHLRERLAAAMAELPEALDTYKILCQESDGRSAVDLYSAARRRLGPRCKTRLDQLATLGALTRFISDERAGIRLVPLSLPPYASLRS